MFKIFKTIGFILICLMFLIIGIILAANDKIVLSFIGFFILILCLSEIISVIKKNIKNRKIHVHNDKNKNNKNNQDF